MRGTVAARAGERAKLMWAIGSLATVPGHRMFHVPDSSPAMLAKLFSYTLIGIDATPMEVEVDVSASSMPKTVLVGLAEAAVKQSTHRVERAIV